MKRPLSFAAALLLSLSLAACSQKAPESLPEAPVSSKIESAATESSSSLEETPPTVPEKLLVQIQTANGDAILFQLNDSTAASSLYQQLPLTVDIEDYADSEKIFYPPERLDISNTPLAKGPAGTLAYYEPWGDVAFFYADCNGASGLYELGEAMSGTDLLPTLSGEIRITAVEESAETGREANSSASPQEENAIVSAPPAQTKSDPSAPPQELKAIASTPPPETKSSASAAPQETPSVVSTPAEPAQQEITQEPAPQENLDAMQPLQIIVGTQSFTATLNDNAATRALIQKLPLTLTMREMNGNEKYHYLPDNLPTYAGQPSGIQVGDFMLYGSDCLVLFYESFSTSYRYTPLGRIDDPAGLSEALGTGNVQVSFQIAK